MSHHNQDHNHDHDHDHDHHHGHDHHHSHTPMSFSEKLVKLLDHWVEHNDNHIEDYRKWAKEARDNGQEEVAALLESAVDITGTVSDRFREAGKKVKP